MTAYFVNLFRHHMCLIRRSPVSECFALGSLRGQCSSRTWREDWVAISDMHTALCKSALDWIQMYVQGNILKPLLCFASHCFPPLLSFYNELTITPEVISAVFEHLDLSKPSKSCGIKPRDASPSLFPRFSWGSALVMIISSPVFLFTSQEFQTFMMRSNSDQLYNLCLITLIGSSDVPSRRQWCTDNPSVAGRLYISLDSKRSKSQFIKFPSTRYPSC